MNYQNFISILLITLLVGSIASFSSPALAQTKTLGIDVKVRDENFGGEFRDSLTVNPGDKIKFQIKVTATGTAPVEDVTLKVALPSKLKLERSAFFINGAIRTQTNFLFGGGSNLGTINLAKPVTITFTVLAESTDQFNVGSTAVTSQAIASSPGIAGASDSVSITIGKAQGSTPFSQEQAQEKSKTVFNQTKGTSGTKIEAESNDILTFILKVKNKTQTPLNSVIIEDDIRDVMEVAQVVNTGGAVVDNGIIKFPAVNIPANSEVSKSFRVKVRALNEIPSNSDFVMVNTFGNRTEVTVKTGQVAGIFTGLIRPPRTGAGEWIVISLAMVFTVGYWFYQRRYSKKHSN